VARKSEGYRAQRLAARRSRRWGSLQNLALYALAAVVAFGAVLGAVHLAHSLRQHHVLPSGASYLALVTIGAGEKQVKPTAALLVHDASLNTSTLYTIPSDLLLTEPGGEYVMAGDVLAEGQLEQYLERLVGAPISYSLDLSYGDLVKLSGGGDLRVTAAPPFSLQTGDVVRLYSGQFSLPASDLPLLLSANGKGTTDQANAQDAFLSAVFAGAALAPAGQRTQTDKAIADRQKGLAHVDARDLLATMVSGDLSVTRLPSNGETANKAAGGQFAWRPDPTAIIAQITRNARGFKAPFTVAVENGSGALGIGNLVVKRLAGLDVNLPPVANADSFDYSVTQILAGAKAFGVANQVRGILGRGVVLTGGGLPGNTIVVIVGKDLSAKDLQ
jgi:LytR cell envelope-related transcriptional attenuator